jgi:hypothetical protein
MNDQFERDYVSDTQMLQEAIQLNESIMCAELEEFGYGACGEGTPVYEKARETVILLRTLIIRLDSDE